MGVKFILNKIMVGKIYFISMSTKSKMGRTTNECEILDLLDNSSSTFSPSLSTYLLSNRFIYGVAASRLPLNIPLRSIDEEVRHVVTSFRNDNADFIV
jgi:hypothetical protein